MIIKPKEPEATFSNEMHMSCLFYSEDLRAYAPPPLWWAIQPSANTWTEDIQQSAVIIIPKWPSYVITGLETLKLNLLLFINNNTTTSTL